MKKKKKIYMLLQILSNISKQCELEYTRLKMKKYMSCPRARIQIYAIWSKNFKFHTYGLIFH